MSETTLYILQKHESHSNSNQSITLLHRTGNLSKLRALTRIHTHLSPSLYVSLWLSRPNTRSRPVPFSIRISTMAVSLTCLSLSVSLQWFGLPAVPDRPSPRPPHLCLTDQKRTLGCFSRPRQTQLYPLSPRWWSVRKVVGPKKLSASRFF